jgi:putative transcriptional regulator
VHRGKHDLERVRALREERNWTQQELGDQLGVSRETVNAIETEKYDPSLPLALKLAKLFAQSVEKMFIP